MLFPPTVQHFYLLRLSAAFLVNYRRSKVAVAPASSISKVQVNKKAKNKTKQTNQILIKEKTKQKITTKRKTKKHK